MTRYQRAVETQRGPVTRPDHARSDGLLTAHRSTQALVIATACVAFLVTACAATPAAVGSPSPAASTAPQVATPTASAAPTASGTTGCVNPPANLASVAALDEPGRLACYGGSTLTFEAVVSKPIQDCGVGPRIEPAWFCMPGVFLVDPNATADSTGGPLAAYWNPASGLTPSSFPTDRTLTITGHFDDPAASTCHVVPGASAQPSASPDPLVLACREEFVVTSVQ
jgi:hypothetical protein